MTDPVRPIFVVGCPRSGTTLLQLMLHAHPRIAIPPENRFFMDVYDSRHELGDLQDPENRRALAQMIVGSKKTRFSELGLDAAQVTEEIVAGPPTVGSALGIVLRAYAARFGKPRWGDKRPSYFHRIPILLRMFPNAQFVQLIRDGRDSVASLLEMDWFKHDVYHAISIWMESIEVANRAPRLYGPQTYYRMYYENLINDPKGELSALCDFLGEEFDPAMCEPAKVAPVAVPERKTWHARTHESVNTKRAGSWRDRLAPETIALCEAVAGDRLRQHGYEVEGDGQVPFSMHTRYLKVAAHRRMAARKRDMIDLVRRRNEPNEVVCRLTD